MKPQAPRLGMRHISALIILSVVVLVPDLVLLAHGRELEFSSTVMVQSVLTWVALVCALSRWRLVLWISLPLLLLAPIESMFISLYGYPSSRHVIALVSETTLLEASEFLSGLWPMLIFGLFAVSVLWAWLYRWLPDQRLVGRRIQLTAIALILAGSFGLELARALPEAPLGVRQFSWANTYPVGVPFRIAGYLRKAAKVAQTRAAIDRFDWHATATVQDLDLVFVIGESSRPDHWTLGGYERDTNPLLSAMGDVIFLPDLVTPWTLTRYSVPAMLARKPATMADILPEKSVVAAFRQAGFETYWFANQTGIEEVSLHMREAEFVRVYNFAVGRGDVDAEFDGAMLPAIRDVLNGQVRRKLLVVHTKGSHWDYDRRYPPEFAHFKPDRRSDGESGKYDRASRATLVNAYDNSIRYTDYFLSEIIATLRDSGRPSALVYVSDHGEGLYDGECKLFGHGNDLEASFRTAGLVWLSPSLFRVRPQLRQGLLKNAHGPILTARTIMNTLADVGTLSIAVDQFSLVSKAYEPQTRWANTIGGAVDFDKSRREGACKLLAGHDPKPGSDSGLVPE